MSIKRASTLGLVLVFALLVAGCGTSIESIIAEHYPPMGSVVDKTLQLGDRPVSGRYHGRWFVSKASVPETARQIAALRRPRAMTAPNDKQMALRYDGFNKRVVMIHRANSADPASVQGETIIEVLKPRHAYYMYYPFMVGYWGGYSPYYHRYGRAFERQYGYNTVTVGNDGTVRRSTVHASTRGYLGGGPGWGK